METNSPEDAEIIVQKLPSDMGIHRIDRKGTLKAPEKILNSFEFNQKVLIDEVFPDEFDLENNHRRIEFNTEEMLEYEKPILLYRRRSFSKFWSNQNTEKTEP